jgi:hypothetical protein
MAPEITASPGVVAPPALAGSCIQAYMFICGWCQIGTPLYNPRGIDTTKGIAEKVARANGWSKSGKLGWICPTCKGQKPEDRQVAAPTTMMELV